MHARRLSIILLLGTLWIAPAGRADDGAEPAIVARQNYSYDPRTRTVTLDLKTVYRGGAARSIREIYRSGVGNYAKDKLDYYRTMYDTVSAAALPTAMDDGETIEIAERYTIGLTGSEDDEPLHRFAIYPDLMRGFFSRLPAQIHHPYPLDPAFDQRDIVTVDASTLGLYAIPGATVSSAYFTFTRNARALPGHIEMDYRLRFLADSVPVGEFERYRADVERMDHNIYAWIDLDRDFYHRYYKDIPDLIRLGTTAAVSIAVLGGAWWFLRRLKPGKT